MPYDNHIRSFYEYIQSQGGVRYAHQWIVQLKCDNQVYGSHTAAITKGYGSDLFEKIKNGHSKDVNDLTFYAQSTKIPATTLQNGNPVSFLAAGFVFPGIVQYDKSWNVSILLDQQLTIYSELLYWKELMSSYALNNGGHKTIPGIDADIWLLSNDMEMIQRRFLIKGIFITDLAETKMQYKEGTSAEKTCECTFAMQWFEQVEPGVDNGTPIGIDGL